MLNKDIIKILDDITNLLNNLDKTTTFDGLSSLWSAKQQIAVVKTILTVEEQLNEDTNDE